MHLTKIILKDGRVFKSPIEKRRLDPDVFEHSYIKIFGCGRVFYVKDIKSAVTERDRISVSKVGDVNEIEKMREMWSSYKKGELKGLTLIETEYKLPTDK